MSIGTVETRRPLPGGLAVPRGAYGARLARMAVFGLFFVTLALSVCMVKWSIGPLPVRALVAMSLLLFVAAGNIGIILGEIVRFRSVLVVTAIVALVGVTASLLNGADLGAVGRQLIEIHLQAAINLIVGACVLRVCGFGRSVFVLVVVVGASSLFALLQFLGVGAAFGVRNFLESFQPVIGADGYGRYFEVGGRARGLSYSPVHLGTQLCLLFASMFGFFLHAYGRRILERLDVRVLLVAAFVAVVSIASGNRSPILGVVIFLVVYTWAIKPKLPALVFTLVALAIVPFIDQLFLTLQELGLRVGSRDDGSAIGRTSLQVYGLMLFLDQPFGYGLDFNSLDYAAQYWSRLIGLENAEAVTKHALHNYYLLMLNKYGALILPVALFVVRKWIRSPLLALGFVPYMVHIFYHNDGPYQADFIIWFVIPLFSRIGSVGWLQPAARRRATTPPGVRHGWSADPSGSARRQARQGVRP